METKETTVEPVIETVAPAQESTLPTQDVLLLAQARLIAEEMRARNIDSFSDYQVAAAYAAVYARITDDRKRTIREVEKMRNFYLVDVIIQMLVEDSLSPEIGTGDILNITSTRQEIQKEIDWLEERFDLDQLAQTIAPDLVAYGEYILQTRIKVDPAAKKRADQGEALLTADATSDEEEDSGLLDLLDVVEQGTVVALTKYANIEGYLVSNPRGMPDRKEPADYVKFSLNSSRIRIDLHKEFKIDAKKCEDIPRYVRCGKSVIFPILSKLKELELLEAMVPATKLSKLSSGTVLGVQVPPGYDTDKALEAARRVEQMINKKIGVDAKLGEITLENIIASAGKHKVIPMFGDKGTIAKIDYKSDEPDEMLASIADLRKAILTSSGIPYELLFSNDGADGAGNILKKYARYLRKLKAIQKAIEEGMRQICYIHLANKGIKFKTEDIKVEFYNKLIEIDHLDHLEFADTTIGMMKNVQEFITGLASAETNPTFFQAVDITSYLEFMNNHLNMVGFHNTINIPKFKELQAKRNAGPQKPQAQPAQPPQQITQPAQAEPPPAPPTDDEPEDDPTTIEPEQYLVP